MKGSTLGDTNRDDSLDAKNWIKKQKKRAKEREREQAEKRAKEMEERDQAIYDERELLKLRMGLISGDMAGLKVAHNTDDFETGEDVILTLKDSRVLAADEDELQNVNLIEDEAVKAAKERKRKAEAQYTGFDDEEFDENRIGKKADVLGKYDDDFTSGKVRNEVRYVARQALMSEMGRVGADLFQGFRLGAPVVEKRALVQDDDTEMLGSAPTSKVKLNLDYAKDFESSDYLREGDAGFKKPKKKKVKRSARRADADEGEDGMDVDEPIFNRRAEEEGPQNLVDDDDLQAALARSRRANAKKKPKVKAEDMVAQSKYSHICNLPFVPNSDKGCGANGDSRI